VKIGVLISGRGSNLKSLIDACAADDFPAEIVLVISNNPQAGGLQYAEDAEIPTRVINHRVYDGRESFDAALDDALRAAGVELVCNAGFMRILTAGFVEKWRDRQLNIHPSLLPAFKGLNVHERVIETGVRLTGCTVHFVRAEMDDGPIVAQAAVPVLTDDAPGDVAARVLKAEHLLYPFALRLVAEGKAFVSEERVKITGVAQAPEEPLFLPPLG